MRILLNTTLQWANATWDFEREVFNCEGTARTINPCNILAIEDDTRNQYIKCTACGEKFMNTEEERARHLRKKYNLDTCYTCPYLRVKNAEESLQFIVNDDHQTFTEHRKVTLACSIGIAKNILSDKARQTCRYAKCSEDTFKSFEDVFIKYPKCFDELLCVDAFMHSDNWRLKINTYESYCESLTRTRIVATINTETGIVREFSYLYRNEAYNFRYSARYDKIFWMEGRTYTETPPTRVDEKKLNTILNLIRPLYKGE